MGVGPEFGKVRSSPAIQIEVLPDIHLGATPGAINDSGVMVGQALFQYSPAVIYHAVRWTRSSPSSEWEVQDLHGLLPSSPSSSSAQHVNDEGVVIGYMEIGGMLHGFVLPPGGSAVDLGVRILAADVSEAGELVGGDYSGDVYYRPLYWATPGAAPEPLPPLENGLPVEGSLFFTPAGEIVGIANDATGRWLARWFRGGGSWLVERLQPVESKGPRPFSVNAAGEGVGYGCPPPSASCDPLYDTSPFYWPTLSDPAVALPTLSRLRTYVFAINDAGVMVGAGHIKGYTASRPLMWPNPGTVIELPLLPKGTGGGASDLNDSRQVVGGITVSDKNGTKGYPVMWILPS